MKPYLFIFFFLLFLNLLNKDQWKVFARIRSTLQNYFLEQDSPFNIAVFRIVFFAYILLYIDKDSILWFSQLPSNLIFPPVGMKCFLSVVPVTPDLVQKMMFVLIGSAFLAMLGVFSRTSSFLAAISGIYVLGITQFYGMVGCPNHLIWIMLVLSVSRCGDVLSVDAIWKAFREADRHQEPSIRNAVEYALPLRLIWLLMAVVYFFPGFWKFFKSQWAWACSENFKYLLYGEWFGRGGWLPFFRIDQYPVLYKISGLMSMFFELSFVVLVLLPASRPIAAVSGIIFHNMIGLFMQIEFLELQICYLSFVNWAGLFIKIGERAFQGPRYWHYDGNSRNSRRMASLRNRFDIFQRTIYVNAPSCTGHSKVVHHPALPVRLYVPDQQLLKFVGVTLIAVNSFFGVKEMTGWPFTCYPTFSRLLMEPITETITPYGVINDREYKIGLDALGKRMAFPRFVGMMQSILAISDENLKRDKLKTLISVMKKEGFKLDIYSKVRFYQAVYSTQPEKVNEPPVSRQLLEEVVL